MDAEYPDIHVPELPNGTRKLHDMADEHSRFVRKVGRVEGIITHGDETPAEEHIRELGKLATQMHRGDVQRAVACLQRQRDLARLIGADEAQPLSWFLRLPLYLQAAGRMPEALLEFRKLTDQAARRAKDKAAWPIEKRQQWLHGDLEIIYDKLCLAWEREDNYECAREARAQSIFHERKRRSLARRERMLARESSKGRSF